MHKSKLFLITRTFIIILLIFVGFIYYFFYSMSRLPKGDYLNQYMSPNGAYTIKTYLCNGGATVDYAIRAELIKNYKKNNKPKNIYWDYKIDNATITWIGNDTVIINNHQINLPNGSYDWRKKD